MLTLSSSHNQNFAVNIFIKVNPLSYKKALCCFLNIDLVLKCSQEILSISKSTICCEINCANLNVCNHSIHVYNHSALCISYSDNVYIQYFRLVSFIFALMHTFMAQMEAYNSQKNIYLQTNLKHKIQHISLIPTLDFFRHSNIYKKSHTNLKLKTRLIYDTKISLLEYNAYTFE